MNPAPEKTGRPEKPERRIPAVSSVFNDGSILETVYQPQEKRSAFVLWKDGKCTMQSSFQFTPTHRLVPYSPHNNLIKNDVVLLPSEPEEYGSEADLLAEIQSFIHRYVDVSPLFEQIATYYVLLTWVYDRFNELPYLRLRGDPGSGKTRFLLTVGSLCYKPIFASGASTVSPIFRILDAFRGTLIIDEGDFRLSDERAEIVKILNNGNAKGFPVLRSEASKNKEFNPRAYTVFGPKIVATRGFFEDKALESRCLTEAMGHTGLRDDVPINLPPEHKEEALHLRNKLLLLRFHKLGRAGVREDLVDRSIEPRLNQIFVPLLSIIDDAQAREALMELARKYNRELIADRGMETEAQILDIIRDMMADPFERQLSVKQVASWFIDRHGADYKRTITTKWIGTIIRKKLGLQSIRTREGYFIPDSEKPKFERLFERYGINPKKEDEQPGRDVLDPDFAIQPTA
ncbi:MAG TPA: hypothetical protein VE422_30680 [Terriglobia bacterium]|nr:hypothetical protein [Terriglobia bacterium]